MPKNLVSRDGFSRPVPRQPAHLHTQAESGAYLRDSYRVPRRRPFMKPPYAIGSVPCLSGHANAYRWRSLPRVRRHRASKPQGSSERVLPWQVTMDQLIIIIIIIINDTLARSLEPLVTECKEHTIHTQTQIVASRKPKEIKHTHEGEANFQTLHNQHKSPLELQYTPLFPTPTMSMKWAC